MPPSVTSDHFPSSLKNTSDYASWLTSPTTLDRILAFDCDYSSRDGVTEAFGDQYLCETNPLHARIRTLFRSFGFSYSVDSDLLSHDYNVLSLLTLQHLVDRGVVPVVDNTATLHRLLRGTSDAFLTPTFLIRNLRRNYLLHESAHCIAHRVLMPFLGEHGQAKNTRFVLSCLLAESYANAVERLASFAADSHAHKFLFTLNSFVESRKATAVAGSLSVLGIERALSLGICVFLRLNRRLQWTAADTNGLLQLWYPDRSPTDCTPLIVEILAEHFSGGLNSTFINETNPVFFAYMGCKEAYDNVCSGEVPIDPEDWQEASTCMTELVTLTVGGLSDEGLDADN